VSLFKTQDQTQGFMTKTKDLELQWTPDFYATGDIVRPVFKTETNWTVC